MIPCKYKVFFLQNINKSTIPCKYKPFYFQNSPVHSLGGECAYKPVRNVYRNADGNLQEEL